MKKGTVLSGAVIASPPHGGRGNLMSDGIASVAQPLIEESLWDLAMTSFEPALKK